MRVLIFLLLVLPALVLLTSCAFGVRMSDAEAVACHEQGCSVWTEAELRELARRADGNGYQRGWRDATRQRSEGI